MIIGELCKQTLLYQACSIIHLISACGNVFVVHLIANLLIISSSVLHTLPIIKAVTDNNNTFSAGPKGGPGGHVPPPIQKTWKFGECMGGHLSPVPRLWGWSVCPPSMLPLQISCSLAFAKLIKNSCAPPTPLLLRPDSEKLGEPQSLGCSCAGLCYWVRGE